MKSTVLRIAEGFPGERLSILPGSAVRRSHALPVCRDLCVTHIGRFDQVRGHYVSRPHGRPEHVLIVCLSGNGRVWLEGKLLHLRRGYGIVLPPRRAHVYSADMDDPWSLFWVHFEGKRATDYVAALALPALRPRFWVQNVENLEESFEECHRHVRGGYTDAELIGLSTGFARLLGQCRTLQRSTSLRRRKSEDRVLRTLRFMREHLGENLTLAQMAGCAGLSVAHLGAIFRRQLNCSPIEFHIRLRLHRACELLEISDHTVSEIAHALGYADPLYFSRLFRQKIGQSPSDFRAAHAPRRSSGQGKQK